MGKKNQNQKTKKKHPKNQQKNSQHQLQQGFKAQNALEKEIVSHIHLVVNFYDRLSPALNTQHFITKKDLDAGLRS